MIRYVTLLIAAGCFVRWRVIIIAITTARTVFKFRQLTSTNDSFELIACAFEPHALNHRIRNGIPSCVYVSLKVDVFDTYKS